MTTQRTPPSIKAKELAKLLRAERPDYSYLKSVFRALREELEIVVPRKEERLPKVPKEGIDDALIQPYSGHTTRQSLEIYSKLSLADAQGAYDQAMECFPIQ